MPYISTNDLSIVRDLILKHDVEACGLLLTNREQEGLASRMSEQFPSRENPNELQLFIDAYGRQENGRGMCRHRGYTKYVWHTHPKGLIAYPSTEDIMNILKWHLGNDIHNFPVTHLVFSNWGIWEVHSAKKFQMDSHWIKFLYETIKPVIDKLWYISDKGLVYTDDVRPHIDAVIREIKTRVNKDREFNLQIAFTPWSDVRKTYAIIYD